MIAIVKYNAGNIRSLLNCLDRLSVDYEYTDNPKRIREANKVIFPGVGEAKSAMAYLKEHGLVEVLTNLKQPFLGICLGMQLMCSYSEERDTECLGIFPNRVKLFPPEKKVPHIGWNNFIKTKGILFDGILQKTDMYYVHSYYAELNTYTVGSCHYIKDFSCALQKDNYYGVQFHPEKSAAYGQRLIQNFLSLS